MSLAAHAASSVFRSPSTTPMRSAIGWPSWFLATAATKGAVLASVVRASRRDTPAPIDAVDFDHPGQLQVGVALEHDLQKLVPDAPGRGVGKTSRWMVEREAATVLCGTVQVDDAYLGGELVGGTAGRGSENKVHLHRRCLGQRSMRASFIPVSGFSRAAIAAWASAKLAPSSTVVSDGLACVAGVTDIGCTHQPTVVGTANPRTCRCFAGSIPSSATSRPTSTGFTTALISESMPFVTSARSAIASAAASICRR
nr:transposase [Thiocapsa sp. KS1]